MCSPIWLCQTLCTKTILNYASPDVGDPKTHRTNIEFGRTYFLVCQQTAPSSSAKVHKHCDGAYISKDVATKIEPEETERESACLLTLMPIACCKNCASSLWNSLCALEAILGGPTLPSHVSRASIMGFAVN